MLPSVLKLMFTYCSSSSLLKRFILKLSAGLPPAVFGPISLHSKSSCALALGSGTDISDDVVGRCCGALLLCAWPTPEVTVSEGRVVVYLSNIQENEPHPIHIYTHLKPHNGYLNNIYFLQYLMYKKFIIWGTVILLDHKWASRIRLDLESEQLDNS